MKKFLPLLLAALIFIPAAAAQAADIPSFLRISGRNVTIGEVLPDHISYDCPLNLRENFIEQYLNLLRQNQFTLTEYTTEDFTKYSGLFIENWYLQYNGSKPVRFGTAKDTKGTHRYNLKVRKFTYYEKNYKSFVIEWESGLTYEN